MFSLDYLYTSCLCSPFLDKRERWRYSSICYANGARGMLVKGSFRRRLSRGGLRRKEGDDLVR